MGDLSPDFVTIAASALDNPRNACEAAAVPRSSHRRESVAAPKGEACVRRFSASTLPSMGSRLGTFRMLPRCVTELCTLVVFLISSIGIPALPRPLADASSARNSTTRSCCCAHKRGRCCCGCCQRSNAANCAQPSKGGCCDRKRSPPKGPSASCPCGDQPATGFIVSTQPRLVSPGMEPATLLPISLIAAESQPLLFELELTPDTPPPRPSDC